MRMVLHSPILVSISNPNQEQAGHWVKGRPDLKVIGENNRKVVKMHGLPLRMHKSFNMLARNVLSRRLTREEWGLAQWLVQNLGQTWTDEFLKLPIELIGNPAFKVDMAYSPARAYSDHEGRHQVIDEMWTADWWGEKQKALPEGATIAPIILSLDKMTLSQFQGNKSAWPVYMSIGNIAKAKRHQASAHATMLIGYLPAVKLDCFMPEERSLAGYRLFHHCIGLLLHPLIAAGNDGMEMACANSWIHHCVVACCKQNQCMKCLVVAEERGDALDSVMHDPESTKDILQRQKMGQHLPEFKENGLCSIYKPFWANMPHADIFQAFTPDLLHQVHKGVFKDHLVRWCQQIIGEEEMDVHFKAMPDYPGLRHFKKGILTVKQWTGSERKEMQQVFIGLLTGAVPSMPGSWVLVVARLILDFSYYMRLQIHTMELLKALQTALSVFHAHKDILKELSIREHFSIPKIHQLTHYVQSITLFGAADGFNTELPECLHIDFAKNVYRATNKCDYEEQMVLWLQCQESVFLEGAYLDWLVQVPLSTVGQTKDDSNTYDSDSDSDLDSVTGCDQTEVATPHTTSAECLQTMHVLAKVPAHPPQLVQEIVALHGATKFLTALQSFLQKNLPGFSDTPTRRHIRATPEKLSSGHKPAFLARFDVGLISDSPHPVRLQTLDVVAGLRVAQVHAIFTLPHQFGTYTRPLAYIEWFIHFRTPDPSSGLRLVSHSTHHCRCNAAIIHVDKIVRPCHLIPKMGPSVEPRLRTGNAYKCTNDFYFNHFIDREMFCASVDTN
ncbi:hypothetical protein BD769DRAFT_1626352 [Suillus cothurnatus]|nr:hypothetical protein BD769DRAFT_1626352 [Suillus cothurnatus]